MANTDHNAPLLSESTGTVEVQLAAAQTQGPSAADSLSQQTDSLVETPPQPAEPPLAKDSSSVAVDSQPSPAPTRPALVQLGSGSSQPSIHHPPKKFNAVNINKKFLEKNSAAAALATASASAATKSSNSNSRTQSQTTQSHSRLVTAKLTGSPAPSTTGPGWSRPTSTAPSSTGTNSPIGSSPLPSAAVALSVSTGAPQLPHVGKVIQPQPRAAIHHTTSLQKDGVKPQAKPAWGAVKPPSVPPNLTSQDFPTAAEVAQAASARKPKQDDQKVTPESSSVVKHRLLEEADTFRGVHLDPSARHWDEVEEDNDDFLKGVIEFGDGRQYKVEATEPSTSPPPTFDHNQPVSKQDRFADDFDRSWPISKPSPPSSHREFPATSPVLSSRGTSLHSGQDHSHPQLFNERSNRLEPYSHGPRSGQSTYQNRRGSHNDGPTAGADPRKGNVQLLQKAGGNSEPAPRPPRGMNGGPSRGFSGPMGDRRDSGGPRRDYPTPSSPRMTRNDWGHHNMAPSTSLQGRDREPSERERGRQSDMGPPPLPPHATRRTSRDSSSGRQPPPHLSPNHPLPRRLPSHDRERDASRFGPISGHVGTQATSKFPAVAPPSPTLSHTSRTTSLAALSPGSATIALPGGVTADLNEVTKDLMQSAAARAKARKMQEEAEIEAQKERARKKAGELEEKMKKERETEEKEKEQREQGERKEEEAKAKEQEKEAVTFIESAIDGLKSSHERRSSNDATSQSKTSSGRPPSLRGQQRRGTVESGGAVGAGAGGGGPRRASFGIGARAPGSEISSQAESWRAKAGPLPPPPPTPRNTQPRSTPSTAAGGPQVQSQPQPQPPTTLVGTPSALDHVADIVEGSMTDLEVVDFSNMDKFVEEEGKKEKVSDEEKVTESEDKGDKGITQEETVEEGGKQEIPNKKPRPMASDFFEDTDGTTRSATPLAKGENVWRRRTTTASASTVAPAVETESEDKEKTVAAKEERVLRASSSAPVVSVGTTPSAYPHPLPRLRPHTEVSMSALDDVMSRIKGAMQASGTASKENKPPTGPPETEHHHHHQNHSHPQTHQLPPRTSYPQSSSTTGKSAPHRERWQPAPPTHSSSQKQVQQRQQRAIERKLEELRESLSTSLEPSYMAPSSSPPVVDLPKSSHKIEPISLKQQTSFSRFPFPPKFDLLSFDPPVQGMNRRDFSVNTVLFRGGTGFRANKIRVSLPPGTKADIGGARMVKFGPKYNIGGNGIGNAGGGFGKGTNADGAASWRKAGPSVVAKVEEEKVMERQKSQGEEGGVRARDQDSSKGGSEKQEESVVLPTARTRQQPKMPAGSAVAFIRDSKIDVVEADPKPLVNFIVTSELDEPVSVGEFFSAVPSLAEVEKQEKMAVKDEGAGSKGSTSDGAKAESANSTQSSSSSSAASVVKLKAPEAKDMDETSTTRSISAPSPSHQSNTTSTPWGRPSMSVPIKDVAVRAPDPEHLKAVWSQPNKTDLNPINSLEGIADDLTSVPFSIQDVKSEGGETPPPPLPPSTSRMSLHEVTKAFQKVPSSSPSNSSSQGRNPISPPSNNHTPATRSPYPYSPMPPNAMRLPHSYEHYSPMLSHSPSPTVAYPHQLTSSPVPSRMPVNGHSPMYQAPVWVHQPTSTPGNPGAVMRPMMMSPYPAPMIPYGTPNYGHPMGAMSVSPAQPPVGTVNAAAGRGRGVPLMSPGLSHTGAPMYASSPVMMHMQPLPPHQNHAAPYMGMSPQLGTSTPGRGQSRVDVPQAHHPLQPPTNTAVGQQQHQHHQHSHQPPAYNPTSFIRSAW